MKVWIVAKMFRNNWPESSSDRRCVVGLTENNKNIRFVPRDASQKLQFEVGQICDVNINKPETIYRPHVENRYVESSTYIDIEPDLKSFLMEKISPWQGGIDQFFNGGLQCGINWSSGVFMELGNYMPSRSIGYWIPDQPLFRTTIADKYPAYNYRDAVINYSGLEDAGFMIPPRTLVQVSLRPWWPTPDSPEYEEILLRTPQRCYLTRCASILAKGKAHGVY